MFYHRYEKSNRLFIGVLLFFISFFSDKLPNIFQLQGISYYLFFFCIGYEFDRNKKKIDEFLGNRKWIVILGWILPCGQRYSGNGLLESNASDTWTGAAPSANSDDP